jgi:uncharacterized membrane protein YheB (UPF0754 family)
MSVYLLLTLPLVSGLIGWGTNALAIRMLFRPLEWVGLWRIGWRGVLPANAERMATICVQLMTRHLLDVREVFARIDPEKISELLSPALEKHAAEIVEATLSTRYPRLWESIPRRARSSVQDRVRAEIPEVIHKLMSELREDLDRYLAVEALVIQAFVGNRALLNELFWNCGRSEFLFIARSGLIFGSLFGCVQAAVWSSIQPVWFLPLTGLLIGWLTNWIALKMVFEPQQARTLGPIRWQGLFLMRQAEVSEAYAAFFAERILHPKALVDAVLRGPATERLLILLQRYIEDSVDAASGPARPIVNLAVGTAEWRSLKQDISRQLVDRVPGELDRVHQYTGEALALREELTHKLRGLPPDQFEQVLRPLFRQDERTLIAVGAILGAAAGCIQWLLVGLT